MFYDPRTVCREIKCWFPDFYANTIFDVGASVGDYSAGFGLEFPEATIHAFEPWPPAFQQLRAAKLPRVQCWPYALNRVTAPVHFTNDEARPTSNHISDGGEIEVEGITGREFCARHGISQIDLLKVDAEGWDLDVLEGFDLENVGFVQVEVALNPHVENALPLGDVQRFMEKQDFWLFNIYDAAWEFKDGKETEIRVIDGLHPTHPPAGKNLMPIQRRADAVFINGVMLEWKP